MKIMRHPTGSRIMFGQLEKMLKTTASAPFLVLITTRLGKKLSFVPIR